MVHDEGPGVGKRALAEQLEQSEPYRFRSNGTQTLSNQGQHLLQPNPTVAGPVLCYTGQWRRYAGWGCRLR